MEQFFVYILFSPKIDRYYPGYTKNPESRLDQQNRHVFKGSFTGRAEDWEVVHSILCETEEQAKAIENHIKKKSYLEHLIRYPSIFDRLKEKYRD